MAKAKVAGYVVLFFILFLLIGVYPGFIFLFFGSLIVVIVYYANKRRKSKTDYTETPPNEIESKTENVDDDSKPIDNTGYGGAFPDPDESEKPTDLPKPNKQDIVEESFQKNFDEIIKKKTFNRNYWNFQYGESVFNKERKFLDALDFCEKNNLGSKAKLRRLKMKMKRWNFENERDIEAMMPDYEYLLDLMEEFETRD